MIASKQCGPKPYRPRPATIRRVCEELREGWDEERFQRSGRAEWRRVGYEFPRVDSVTVEEEDSGVK